MAISTAAASQQVPTTEYARLEERIIERDQVGASQVLYGLFKQGRPVTEILREPATPLESYRRFAEALDLAGC
jgi:hypothetical protein